MDSRELVIGAVQNKETERIPWVPFVGCHAAYLMGISAQDYFKSAETIAKGAQLAYERYRPDGLPALFDLQIEAEALGCQVQFSEQNPPAIMSHPLEGDLFDRLSEMSPPGEQDGRFPVVLSAMRKIKEQLGSRIALYGLVTGPFTLGLHLRGTDIFYDIIDKPSAVHALMGFCSEVCRKTAQMYLQSGMDIIAVVDPMTSQISNRDFATFVSPYARLVFDHIRKEGGLSSFFVCGNAQRNIEEMCKCGPDNVSIDENIPLQFVKDIASSYGVSVGGNIQLTVTMLLGSPADNVRDAANCAAIGGKKGYILSPGCDMPFATPPVNVEAISAFVHGEEGEFLARHTEQGKVDAEYALPDYHSEPKVVVDVITLDSESCAPCRYMMEAVKNAAFGLEDRVRWREHKVKTPEGIACMMALGIKNIPSIAMDGEIKYVSLIPDVGELRKTMLACAQRKTK